jgi:hypothetical protein
VFSSRFLRSCEACTDAHTRAGTPRCTTRTQAGYTALPEYALDGDLSTYWSSTGGTVRVGCATSSPLLRGGVRWDALNRLADRACNTRVPHARLPHPACAPRRPQECCSETVPAWLTVSLGALRPIAAVQVLFRKDMTFTLAAANASAGPFVPFASRMCDECLMNSAHILRGQTFMLGGAPVVASFVKMIITWSTAGGMGGCADLCVWCVQGTNALPCA